MSGGRCPIETAGRVCDTAPIDHYCLWILECLQNRKGQNSHLSAFMSSNEGMIEYNHTWNTLGLFKIPIHKE